ncbi:phage baseplate protein [Agitococcus lubricus]|uniref:Baseplate structural protein Gp10 C-terminal domain-containing protein n=1 Tax=Agitococcus lubricus TaxID=1077255 RepID=A0A2T5J458_9GAMM|nr:hypothetical protein [Agitococcus lubricus]PTQ91283.1 hypothetical protein C8N29_101356 [Agitococcus lubricus]
MHRIDTINARPNANGSGKAGYHLNDDLSGVDPTNLDPDALNAIQEEICTVIESQDITLVKGTNNQLLAAIQKMIVNMAYPVHRTIEFAADVDPNQLWPWTTWVRFAQGKTTVGLLDGDADFGTVGQSGGAKNIELSVDQLPEFSLKVKTKIIAIRNDGDADPEDRILINYEDTHPYESEFNTSSIGNGEQIDIKNPYVVTAKWLRTN